MTVEARAGAKHEALQSFLRAHGPLVIAYSGGVDSAFLLAVAVETLGDQCLAVIADSPSLPRQALTNALRLASSLGAKIEIIATGEMENPKYTTNPINRCYYCKSELFAQLEAVAASRGHCAIAYGENSDDMRQVRPGRRAAEEFRVLAPLREVGLTKMEIRTLSRNLGLPTADEPAQPCLSSRIPHGTPVTTVALGMIERAEAIVRGFGFRVFRVRHLVDGDGMTARLEMAPDELPQLALLEDKIQERLREVGYGEIVIDPRGYRATAA